MSIIRSTLIPADGDLQAEVRGTVPHVVLSVFDTGEHVNAVELFLSRTQLEQLETLCHGVLADWREGEIPPARVTTFPVERLDRFTGH